MTCLTALLCVAGVGLVILAGILALGAHYAAIHRAQQRRTRHRGR